AGVARRSAARRASRVELAGTDAVANAIAPAHGRPIVRALEVRVGVDFDAPALPIDTGPLLHRGAGLTCSAARTVAAKAVDARSADALAVAGARASFELVRLTHVTGVAEGRRHATRVVVARRSAYGCVQANVGGAVGGRGGIARAEPVAGVTVLRSVGAG